MVNLDEPLIFTSPKLHFRAKLLYVKFQSGLTTSRIFASNDIVWCLLFMHLVLLLNSLININQYLIL